MARFYKKRAKPLHFPFQLIEILSENTLNFGDGNECVGVFLVDNLHNVLFVGAVCENHQHILVLLGVPAVSLKHRHTAVYLIGNPVGNFLGLVGEYDNLEGFPVAVHYHVGHV